MKLNKDKIASNFWYYVDQAKRAAGEFYTHADPTVAQHGGSIMADAAMVLEDRWWKFRVLLIMGDSAIFGYNLSHPANYYTRLSRHVTWTLIAGAITWGDLLLAGRRELKYRRERGIALADAEYLSSEEKFIDTRFPDEDDRIYVIDGSEMEPESIADLLNDIISKLPQEDQDAYEQHLEEQSYERKSFDPNNKVETLPFDQECFHCMRIITDLRDDKDWSLKRIAEHLKEQHRVHLTVGSVAAGVGWPEVVDQ